MFEYRKLWFGNLEKFKLQFFYFKLEEKMGILEKFIYIEFIFM